MNTDSLRLLSAKGNHYTLVPTFDFFLLAISFISVTFFFLSVFLSLFLSTTESPGQQTKRSPLLTTVLARFHRVIFVMDTPEDIKERETISPVEQAL